MGIVLYSYNKRALNGNIEPFKTISTFYIISWCPVLHPDFKELQRQNYIYFVLFSVFVCVLVALLVFVLVALFVRALVSSTKAIIYKCFIMKL